MGTVVLLLFERARRAQLLLTTVRLIRFEQVRDMYSFSFALAQLKIKMILKGVPYNLLMVQPPADHTLGKSIILHYTVRT